jgi:hypothetical protein
MDGDRGRRRRSARRRRPSSRLRLRHYIGARWESELPGRIVRVALFIAILVALLNSV